MGSYSEYLDNLQSFEDINVERKKQIKRIQDERGRPTLTIASDVEKGKAPISIMYSDLLPIRDQIDNITEDNIDVIIETPGGYAETTEDIVSLLRSRFKDIAFIIPGMAKSAGTIMAMGGDEILMDCFSSLGPIDAQMSVQGKTFSADAFLDGLNKIKEEVQNTGALNRAYIPILQGIHPGEIQNCENAQNFSKQLVTNWLNNYKFRNWATHSSTGQPVSEDDRRQRAEEIAAVLCNHGKWLTHGRSIKIADLEKMKLRITDYGTQPALQDAIRRYYTLLRLTFDRSGIYKVFETATSQIYRFMTPQVAPVQPQKPGKKQIAEEAQIEVQCPKCGSKHTIQVDFEKSRPLKKGLQPFPADNNFICPNCGAGCNLTSIRDQIEAQTKKKVAPPEQKQ